MLKCPLLLLFNQCHYANKNDGLEGEQESTSVHRGYLVWTGGRSSLHCRLFIRLYLTLIDLQIKSNDPEIGLITNILANHRRQRHKGKECSKILQQFQLIFVIFKILSNNLFGKL